MWRFVIIVVLAIAVLAPAGLSSSSGSNAEAFNALLLAKNSVTWVTKKQFGAHQKVYPYIYVNDKRVTKYRALKGDVPAIEYLAGKVTVQVEGAIKTGPITVIVENNRSVDIAVDIFIVW